MKITSVFSFTSLSLFAGFAAQISSAYPGDGVVTRRRTTSILNSPAAQPPLPPAPEAAAAATAASLNLDDIQGDILVGMKKKQELFFFFGITNATEFKSQLHTNIHPLITTVNQLLDVAKQPVTLVNIAFSNTGLLTLGITDNLNDMLFQNGQTNDASSLGDPGTTNWVPGFVGTNVHGVLILASDTVDNINNTLASLQSMLGTAITEIHRLQGAARPGGEEGHERKYFGFMDGISQPGVNGFTASPTPGQQVVDTGVILLGENGDNTTRPPWAKDGSFLAFRQLKQLVPEFTKFLTDNPIVEPGVLTAEQGSALLGARMVGRWKSGAPIDLAPLFDNTTLASDPNQNNNFTFAHNGEDLHSNQTRCPFSAHIRKTNPRADFATPEPVHHIIRGGIPYGPEVTDAESASGVSDSSLERGLAFVAYQSDISLGFHFLQISWANNAGFFFGKSDSTIGVDPIIGVSPGGGQRVISGLDPTDPNHDITLVTEFIVSRGGEYFFSPSLSAILNTISV